MQHRESLFPVAGSAALKPQAEIVTRASLRFPSKHPLMHHSSPAMQPIHFVDSPMHQCGAFVCCKLPR